MLLELVRAWNLPTRELSVEQQAVVLWSGVHGLTMLLLDGALPATAKERDAYLESVVGAAMAGLARKKQ
jgi:hypothetical protein